MSSDELASDGGVNRVASLRLRDVQSGIGLRYILPVYPVCHVLAGSLVLVPVEDRAIRRRLITILKSYPKDSVKGRKLLPDGGYERPSPPAKGRRHRHQFS